MYKDEKKSLSALSAPLTRRDMVTRVIPAGLAAALLLARTSPASARAFLQAKPATPFDVQEGLAAASYGNYAVVTAISVDGGLYYNWWKLGGGPSGWIEIPGEEYLDGAAISFVTNEANSHFEINLWAVSAPDNNIYTNMGGGFGGQFSKWVLLPGLQTTDVPAAAMLNNGTISPGTIFPIVVVTGPDDVIYYMDPNTNSAWIPLDGNVTSLYTPAAALVGNAPGYMFVIVRGNDSQLYLNQGTVGGAFVGWQPTGFTSWYPAGATSSGNTTAVVAIGTDNHIYYNYWTLGGGGSGWIELPGLTALGTPVAALIGNYLFVIVNGSGQVYVNQGHLGGAFTGWNLL